MEGKWEYKGILQLFIDIKKKHATQLIKKVAIITFSMNSEYQKMKSIKMHLSKSYR